MLENLFELDAIFWVNDEDLLEKGLELGQFVVWDGLVALDGRWRGKLFYEVVFGRAADLNVVKQVHALEWVIPEEHVEKNYSQGPDVYLFIVRFAGEDLWCHEIGGTAVRFGSFLNWFTKTEVANLAGKPLIFRSFL